MEKDRQTHIQTEIQKFQNGVIKNRMTNTKRERTKITANVVNDSGSRAIKVPQAIAWPNMAARTRIALLINAFAFIALDITR